jgi:hypothetical protein
VPGVSDRPTEASVCGLLADIVLECRTRCVEQLDYCML